MALATLRFAAVPVLVGLAAGTGALATYAASPSDDPAAAISAPVEPTASAAADAAKPGEPRQAKPCSEQTWPYISRACLSADGAKEPRNLRIVRAPRPEDRFDVRWNAASGVLPPAFPGMTTHDGVLRGPQKVIDPGPVAAAPPPAKRNKAKAETRRRDGSHVVRRTYTVPEERSNTMREVYVVRPQRPEFFD